MADGNYALNTFYENWELYQKRLKEAIAPLTDEQLTLRAAPDLRSIRELVEHIIGTRIAWFVYVLLEDPGEVGTMLWDEPDSPIRSAAELVRGLDLTWQMMAERLKRWSDAHMEQMFTDDWDGKEVHLSRAWVIWHLLEHDLHHGGELSLTLGMHGLQAPNL